MVAASATAFTIVKLLGAIYLAYLGAKMLLAQRNGEETGLDLRSGPVGLSTVFWQGFVTNALNPKTALFFLAFLPQFVDADVPSKVLALLFLGVLFDCNGTPGNLSLAFCSASHGGSREERPPSVNRSGTRFFVRQYRHRPLSADGRQWLTGPFAPLHLRVLLNQHAASGPKGSIAIDVNLFSDSSRLIATHKSAVLGHDRTSLRRQSTGY